MRSGHVLRGFLFSTVEARHYDTYATRFGYTSATYQCALALCLEAVPEGYPPLRGAPLTIIPAIEFCKVTRTPKLFSGIACDWPHVLSYPMDPSALKIAPRSNP